MFEAALFIISWFGLTSDEWVVHVVESCSPIKKGEILMHATDTCVNLKNMVLSERTQKRKATYYVILSICNV